MQMHQPHVRYSAEKYDYFTATFVKPFDEMVAKRVTKEVRVRPPGVRILDVGTGTARLLVHLARCEALATVQLVGVDLFEDMVERARQTVAEAGLAERIELFQQDVHVMNGIADSFANIILSRSTLHHWDDPPRAFLELFRVLKPGGIILIHDLRRDPEPEAMANFNNLRAAAGLVPSFLDEKYTAPEIAQMVGEARLSDFTTIRAPQTGMAALGIEIEIVKPTS